MATTPVYGWPYPAGTDAADVPYWMQQLATAIEGTVSGGTTQPYVMVERTTSLSTTNDTLTLVPWSSDSDDQDNMWSGTPDPSRVTFTQAGRYRGLFLMTFQTNATGYRRVQVRKNSAGSSVGGTNVCTFTINAVSGASTPVSGNFDQRFVAGDYVETFVSQGSGGALSVGNTAGENWLSVQRVLL